MADIASEPILTTTSINADLSITIFSEPVLTTTSIDAGLPVTIFLDTPFYSYTLIGATTTPYIYVVDRGNNRIEVFDYEGNFKFTFGSYGSDNGEFNNPYGITNDGTYLYITDSGNNRVEIFDLHGNYVNQFGTFGTNLGEFDNPTGIAVDNNFIYVVDTNNNRVQFFDKNGNVFFSYGSYGSGEDELNTPIDIDIDNLYLYIDDTGNNRVVSIYKYMQIPNYLMSPIPSLTFNFSSYSHTNKIESSIHNITGDINVIGDNLSSINTTLPNIHIHLSLAGSLISNLHLLLYSNINAITGKLSYIHFTFNFLKSDIYSNTVRYGSLHSKLPIVNISITNLNGNISNISLLLPKLNIENKVITGNTYQFILNLPKLKSNIQNNIGNLLSLSLIFPKTNAILNLYELIEYTYKAILINTKTKSVSEYTNYNFNSIVKFNNKYLLASKNGLYLIGGTTDDGEDIKAEIVTGVLDLNENDIIRFNEMWVDGKNDNFNVGCILENDTTILLPVSTVNNNMQSTRVKLPKGLKDRFISFSINNDKGKFNIHSIKCVKYNMRIRG